MISMDTATIQPLPVFLLWKAMNLTFRGMNFWSNSIMCYEGKPFVLYPNSFCLDLWCQLCLKVRVDFELSACAACLDCASIQHSPTHCRAGTVGFALLVLYIPNIPPSRTLGGSMNLINSKVQRGLQPFQFPA